MILRTYTDKNNNDKIGFAWTAKKETNEALKEQSIDIINYFKAVKNGTPDLEKFKKCTANCNEELLKGITYQTDSETALKRLNNNVNGATQSFKGLRSIGKSLLSGLANFGAAMLIETALSVVIKVIDDYTKRFENRAKEVKAKAEEWESELSTVESNEKSVKSIQDEYFKLADGVDAYGNNISLTSDQYDRYIELSNQIANMYPQIVDSYDAQGNAILKCKDNADLLTQSLKESKDAYYNTIVANGSETWDNAMKNIAADSGETYNNQLEAIEKVREAISKAQSEGKSLRISQAGTDVDYSTGKNVYSDLILDKDLTQALKKIKEETDIDLSEDLRIDGGFSATINEEDFNTVINTLNAQYKELDKLRNDELLTAQTYFQAYLKTSDSFYKGLDEEGQQIADTLFNSLNWDNFYSGFSDDELKDFSKVQDKFDKVLEGLLGEDGTDKTGLDAWNKVVKIQTEFTAEGSKTSVKDLKSAYSEFESVLESMDIDPESKELLCNIVFDKVKMDNGSSVDDTITNITNRIVPVVDNMAGHYDSKKAADVQSYLKTLDQTTLNILEKTKKNLNNMSLDELKDFVSKLKDEADKEAIFHVSVEDATSNFEKLKSSLETVQTVIKDYNEQGYMSFDNLKALLSLDDSYLSMLMNEQGELELTADKYRDLAKAELERLQAAYLQEALDSVNSLETEAQALAYLTSVQDENVSSLNDLIQAKWEDAYATAKQKDLEQGTDAFTRAVDAKRAVWEKGNAAIKEYASTMGDLANTDFVSEQAREINALEDEQEALENSQKALKSKKKELEKQKKALEDHKDALEKEQDALENEKQALEDGVDSIKDYIDLVQDMIKNDKELEKEGLEAQKEYYEKQKEHFDELIEARKESIQEAKEEYEWNEKLKDQQNDYAKSALSAAVASLDDSSAGRKAYKEAQDKLDANKRTLKDSLIEHGYDERINALDKFEDEQDKLYDSLIEDVDKHISDISDYLSDEVQLYRDACSMIDNDHGQLYGQLLNYVTNYTITTEAEFNYMWSQAQQALQHYNTEHLTLFELMNQMQDKIYDLTDKICYYDSLIDAVDSSISNVDTSINVMSDSISTYGDRIDDIKGKIDDLRSSANNTLASLNAVSEADSKNHGYEITMYGRTYVSKQINSKESAAKDLAEQIRKATGRDVPWASFYSRMHKYASGTTSAAGGLSLVGEQGAEMRVLNKGDGILSASITKNLMAIGQNPSAFLANAYSKFLNSLAHNSSIVKSLASKYDNGLAQRNVPQETNTNTISPIINLTIQGDATQSTVRALKDEADKIVKRATENVMNVALQNKYIR